MNWSNLWLSLFGTTTWLNIDIGFWVSMGISALVAILMIVVFWSTKPYQAPNDEKNKQNLQNENGENKIIFH